MDEKINCTVVMELLQETRQISKRVSTRRWSWRVVGNEVRDEEGGSLKVGSFFVNGNGNAVRLFKNSTFFISESNNLAQKET